MKILSAQWWTCVCGLLTPRTFCRSFPHLSELRWNFLTYMIPQAAPACLLKLQWASPVCTVPGDSTSDLTWKRSLLDKVVIAELATSLRQNPDKRGDRRHPPGTCKNPTWNEGPEPRLSQNNSAALRGFCVNLCSGLTCMRRHLCTNTQRGDKEGWTYRLRWSAAKRMLAGGCGQRLESALGERRAGQFECAPRGAPVQRRERCVSSRPLSLSRSLSVLPTVFPGERHYEEREDSELLLIHSDRRNDGESVFSVLRALTGAARAVCIILKWLRS